jgi:hypothetical protein
MYIFDNPTGEESEVRFSFRKSLEQLVMRQSNVNAMMLLMKDFIISLVNGKLQRIT